MGSLQLYVDKNGLRNFTFLNELNKSIYFYGYDNGRLIKKITLNYNTDSFKPASYFIKNQDSIYVFNKANMEVLLINNSGSVSKIISLIENKKLKDTRWVFKYPQYNVQTANSFILNSNELIFPGQYISSIPDSLIDKFRFLSHINLKTNKVKYTNLYPKNLYGNGYNWNGQVFTEAFICINPTQQKIIYSFPISHNLYISDINKPSPYHVTFGGSNEVGTISSLTKSKKLSRSEIENHIVKSDSYGAIFYDPYRDVYYRFIRKALQNGKENNQWKDKSFSIIIMDKNFKYLGEETLGTLNNWIIKNAFITEEGLNIEYVENVINEEYLTLKILKIKKEI